MIFSSLEYLLFLPVVVLIYWSTRGAVRLGWLVAASFFFYMSWLPIYGLLVLAMTVINWLFGRIIEPARVKGDIALAKAMLVLGVFFNLGLLCYYKYTSFLLLNLASSLNWAHGLAPVVPAWDMPVINILLPLGISFFTFEFIHYLVDVYKGDRAVRSLPEFAAFAAFFPSQIAGPIKRYQEFTAQLRNPEPLNVPLFNEGVSLILRGLFKKVAIADPIGIVVATGFALTGAPSSFDALVSCIGFVIQIYCDFSGYTDIGRGSALLLGIRLPENFKLPYLAQDLSQFWRRWHMSLGAWLRDYVYIPLGGSRSGKWITARNLFITMVACGLWHGASWQYVAFGAMLGIGLIVNRQWNSVVAGNAKLSRFSETAVARCLGTVLTMLFITVCDTVFRSPNMVQALTMINGWFNIGGTIHLADALAKSGAIAVLSFYLTFWLITEIWKFNLSSLTDNSFASAWAPPARWAAWTAAVIIMIAASPTEAVPFVYFQF